MRGDLENGDARADGTLKRYVAARVVAVRMRRQATTRAVNVESVSNALQTAMGRALVSGDQVVEGIRPGP